MTVDRDPEAAYAPPGEDEEDPDGIDVMEGLSENPTIEELIEHLQICLLYTSPSPRDQRGSRMPSSA